MNAFPVVIVLLKIERDRKVRDPVRRARVERERMSFARKDRDRDAEFRREALRRRRIDDLIDHAEKLAKHKCPCPWANTVFVKRDVLADFDLMFCQVEACAELLDQLSIDNNDNPRLELGAVLLLKNTVQAFRTKLDSVEY